MIRDEPSYLYIPEKKYIKITNNPHIIIISVQCTRVEKSGEHRKHASRAPKVFPRTYGARTYPKDVWSIALYLYRFNPYFLCKWLNLSILPSYAFTIFNWWNRNITNSCSWNVSALFSALLCTGIQVFPLKQPLISCIMAL